MQFLKNIFTIYNIYLYGVLQALSIISCKQSTISDIHSIDSAKFHVVVNQSSDILVQNMHVTAPENSPNTDGINVQFSQNVLVNNSVIATGKKF